MKRAGIQSLKAFTCGARTLLNTSNGKIYLFSSRHASFKVTDYCSSNKLRD